MPQVVHEPRTLAHLVEEELPCGFEVIKLGSVDRGDAPIVREHLADVVARCREVALSRRGVGKEYDVVTQRIDRIFVFGDLLDDGVELPRRHDWKTTDRHVGEAIVADEVRVLRI